MTVVEALTITGIVVNILLIIGSIGKLFSFFSSVNQRLAVIEYELFGTKK